LQSQIVSQLWKTYAKVNIERACESIRENIQITAKESAGYYELKKHKPWFEEACSKLLDQRKEQNYNGYRIQAA
jgi:hypothetical protein